jgi:hypothetical protein
MDDQLRSEAARVISEYLGWEVRPEQVDVVADPHVDGVVAVQVSDALEGTYQFLYNTFEGVDSVDEVEFVGGWPPLPRFSRYPRRHPRRRPQ